MGSCGTVFKGRGVPFEAPPLLHTPFLALLLAVSQQSMKNESAARTVAARKIHRFGCDFGGGRGVGELLRYPLCKSCWILPWAGYKTTSLGSHTNVAMRQGYFAWCVDKRPLFSSLLDNQPGIWPCSGCVFYNLAPTENWPQPQPTDRRGTWGLKTGPDRNT